MDNKKPMWLFHCNDDSCSICKKYDNKMFDDYSAPKLPLHPNCRCYYESVAYDILTSLVKISKSSLIDEPIEKINEPIIPQSLSYENSINRAYEIIKNSNELSHISDEAMLLLKKYETPYSKYLIKDNKGQIIGIKPYNANDNGITVGFGHHISYSTILKDSEAYGLTQRNLSIKEADKLLKNDLDYFEKQVLNVIKKNDIFLVQHEFDALVLQAYNYGNINYLIDFLKTGNRDKDDWIEITTKRMEKNKNTGNYNGLMNRRYQEIDLFLYGDYDGGPDVKKYP